jgi:NADH:ubiquinone oxidoreductase subunit 2 (subunit N)
VKIANVLLYAGLSSVGWAAFGCDWRLGLAVLGVASMVIGAILAIGAER